MVLRRWYGRSEDNDTCFVWGLSQLCGAGVLMGRGGEGKADLRYRSVIALCDSAILGVYGWYS